MTIDDAIMPMINIVFLLLVFFLVAGRLAAGEPFRVSPPLAELGEAPNDNAPLILMGIDKAFALDGTQMPEPQLLRALSTRADGAPAKAVRLKVDAALEAESVARFLETLKETGVEKVRLMTQFSSTGHTAAPDGAR